MGTSAVLNGVERKPQFPFVAKAKDTNLHVLFVTETNGTIVVVGREPDALGRYSGNFISCFNEEHWQILDSVTITFKS